MERIEKGKGVVALLNGRARKVTPKVVRELEKTLPEAIVLISNDLEQARRHAARIAGLSPSLVLCGGGDGTIAELLNLLRAEGMLPFPAIGPLKLGTGNAWANAMGAGSFTRMLSWLPRAPRRLPTQTFNLIETEGRLCQFTGLGWDGRVLNDYLRNLDRRSSQLFASRLATRLHKGLGGYLYAISRMSIPEELKLTWHEGQAHVTVETDGSPAFTLDPEGKLIPWEGLEGRDPRILFEGPVSLASIGTVPEFGFRFRAFPFARVKPGYANLRIYSSTIMQTLARLPRLWRGKYPLRGMQDFFVQGVRLRFSRPMAFQIGGDGAGHREQLAARVARETVEVVDWPAARELARAKKKRLAELREAAESSES